MKKILFIFVSYILCLAQPVVVVMLSTPATTSAIYAWQPHNCDGNVKHTSIAEIIHEPSWTPPKTFHPGAGEDDAFAQHTVYQFDPSIKSYDAVSVRMRPLTEPLPVGIEPPMAYKWGYYGSFGNITRSTNTFYIELTPTGKYGKTASFRILGRYVSLTSNQPHCESSDDFRDGAHCTIPFEWKAGTDYDLMITMSEINGDSVTWEANIYNVATQEITPIGAITTKEARSIDNGHNFAFALYDQADAFPCPNQPASEVLFFTPTPYYRGVKYASGIDALHYNQGCNVQFYSDHKTYSYMTAGYDLH